MVSRHFSESKRLNQVFSHRSRAIKTCRWSQGYGLDMLFFPVNKRTSRNCWQSTALQIPSQNKAQKIIVTKVVMAEKIKGDLCNQSEMGRNLLETFVLERIKSGKVNFWSPMKKRKLLPWKTNAKVLKVSTKEKVVELREDRSLFARMLMVCKTHPEIDIKESVGQYEFSLVPRSLFAADGLMLHYSSKKKLCLRSWEAKQRKQRSQWCYDWHVSSADESSRSWWHGWATISG